MAGPSIPPNLHRFLNPPSPSPPFSSLHTQASTMEKTLQDPLETNLEEWEFLPDNTSFLQFGLDEIEDLTSNEIIYADYFREEPKLIKQAQAHNQEEESQFKDISISHVFLKMINPKVDEELIERTIPSSEPKQSIAELVVREIEAPPSVFLMEEKVILGEKGDLEEEEEKEEEEKAIWEGIGFGIWRWRLIGVGALFSIGAAAAATICVVVLGGREANQSPCRRRHPSNIVQFHFQDEDEERRGMASRRSIDNVAEELKSLSLRSTTGGGGGEILEEEEDEAVRFANVRRKDFKRLERVRGRLINILEGLELHTGVFSVAEQRRIVDCIYDIQEKGRKGRLRERTYSEPRKWMRGKGRITIQFGCCYNYAQDSNGKPPGIIRDEEVDPIPPLLKQMIKRMVAWHVLPPTCIPNSCIVNIYDKDDCIPPHIDHHDFVRPFCTVSFLSECNIVFGTELKIIGPGDFSGSVTIPLPLGSVLVLNGNGADVAKHCVPAVPARRISVTFRKMDDAKIPYKFSPDPDLLNLSPLSLRRQQQPSNLRLRQDQPPQNAQPTQKVQHVQKVQQSPAQQRPVQLTEDDFPPLSSNSRVQTRRR